MYPILFRIGPIAIPGYGVALMVGFLVSMYLAEKNASRFDIPKKKLSDLFPNIILGAVIGARLFHVLVERPSYFLKNPLDAFKIWDGGVTFYGGLIVGFLVVYRFCKKNNISLLNLSDFLITYVALGQGFGRIGCTLAGCCHGIPTDLPWGIAIYNPESATRPLGIPLHPTQIYQMLINFSIFFILNWRAKKKKFVGENLLLYGMLYPIGRSFVEIFRGDSVRGYIIDNIITTSQGISIVIFIISLTIYIKQYRKYKNKKA